MVKLREIEQTPEELNKLTGDTPVYKSIGMILVRQDDREALKEELEEHKETLTIRVKSLQKQEKALSERYEDLLGCPGHRARGAAGRLTSSESSSMPLVHLRPRIDCAMAGVPG